MADDQDPPVKIPIDAVQRDEDMGLYKMDPETYDEKVARTVTESYNRATGGDVPKKYQLLLGVLLAFICIGIAVTAYLLFKDAL